MNTPAEKVANAGTWTGIVMAVFSDLTIGDVGVIFGMVLGTLSMLYNWWHKRAVRKILRDKQNLTIIVDE